MDAQVKAKWVAALRSGKYKQGQGALKQQDSPDAEIRHCCLGVLLEVLGSTVVASEKYDDVAMLYRITDLEGKTSAQMPSQLARQVADFGPYDCGKLADMNDTVGASFEEIADHIEKNL